MTEARKGILAVLLCCVIWGLSPLYYALLSHIPPLEVLSHRVLWSLLFFVLVLALQSRLGEVKSALTDRNQIGWIVFAAVMISFNWLVFIWAVGQGRLTESSFGYYIFPLVAVLFGVVLFRERLSRVQWICIALAATAVVILGFGLGAPPWISLALAISFGIYGVLKKRMEAGPMLSVTSEVVLAAPFAVLFLLWMAYSGTSLGIGDVLLLMVSGPITAIPLVLFSYGSRRINLSTVGVIQYVNPTLQFICAVTILSEPVSLLQVSAFGMIWLALAIYSIQSFRQESLSNA